MRDSARRFGNGPNSKVLKETAAVILGHKIFVHMTFLREKVCVLHSSTKTKLLLKERAGAAAGVNKIYLPIFLLH